MGRFIGPIRFSIAEGMGSVPSNTRAFLRTQFDNVVRHAQSLNLPFMRVTQRFKDYTATFIYDKEGRFNTIRVEPIGIAAKVISDLSGFIYSLTDDSEKIYTTSIGGFIANMENKDHVAGYIDWTDGENLISWGDDYGYRLRYHIGDNDKFIYKDGLVLYELTDEDWTICGACYKNNTLLVFEINTNRYIRHKFIKQNEILASGDVTLTDTMSIKHIVTVNESCTEGAFVGYFSDKNYLVKLDINFDKRVVETKLIEENTVPIQYEYTQDYSQTGTWGGGYAESVRHEEQSYSYIDSIIYIFVDYIGDDFVSLTNETTEYSKSGVINEAYDGFSTNSSYGGPGPDGDSYVERSYDYSAVINDSKMLTFSFDGSKVISYQKTYSASANRLNTLTYDAVYSGEDGTHTMSYNSTISDIETIRYVIGADLRKRFITYLLIDKNKQIAYGETIDNPTIDYVYWHGNGTPTAPVSQIVNYAIEIYNNGVLEVTQIAVDDQSFVTNDFDELRLIEFGIVGPHAFLPTIGSYTSSETISSRYVIYSWESYENYDYQSRVVSDRYGNIVGQYFDKNTNVRVKDDDAIAGERDGDVSDIFTNNAVTGTVRVI